MGWWGHRRCARSLHNCMLHKLLCTSRHEQRQHRRDPRAELAAVCTATILRCFAHPDSRTQSYGKHKALSPHAEWLDSTIEPEKPKTAKAVAKKIAVDQLIYAPVFTCVLYSFLQLAHGDAGSIPEVLQVRRTRNHDQSLQRARCTCACSHVKAIM